MFKKMIAFFLSVGLLLAGVIGVFWFNASPASRNTVMAEKEESTYVDDSFLQDNDAVVGDPDQGVILPPDDDTQGSQNSGGDNVTEDAAGKAYEQYVSSLMYTSEAAGKGYDRQTYAYGANVAVVFESKLSEHTDSLTPATIQRARYYYTYSHETGKISSYLDFQNVPMLSLYGGLLIENTHSGQYILSWLGERAYNAMGYYPVYAKDEMNRPIFYRDGQYYFFDEEYCVFALTKEPASKGLYFDYTPDYGNQNTVLTPFLDEESGLWGYRNENGETVIKAQYYKAYSFGENGIAVVQQKKLDGLLFIDTMGKTVYDSHLQYYTYNGNLAYDWFRTPEDLSEKSIGCFYFDHGYMRVKIETYSLSNSIEVLLERDALVDVKGNILPIPADYTLVGYSDGVAVLEKNGYYGYYSYTGRWLVNPIYKSASAFVGGIGVLCDQSGKYSAIDNEGNVIIPPVFDYISTPSMGKILCYAEKEGWILLSLYEKSETSSENGEETNETKDELTAQ